MAIENYVAVLKAREHLLLDELVSDAKDYGFLQTKKQYKIVGALKEINYFLDGYNYAKNEKDIILSDAYMRGDLL